MVLKGLCPFLVFVTLISGSRVPAEERHQSFDKDPGWEGQNNRAQRPEPRQVRQDFGYSTTRHCRSGAGEIGGFITPAGEPAYYAASVSKLTLQDRFEASGKLACTGRQFHVLVGFFNSATVGEWRTANSIVLRLYGRGDVFYPYVEYATSRWRAGGDSPGGFALIDDPQTGRKQLQGFATGGAVHSWSITYDPQANEGCGRITAKIDEQTAICDLGPGHQQDGATFDRFGLLAIPKHFDDGGEVWLDDIAINGRLHEFSADPGWEERGNRRIYLTHDVRPRFDFGYSPTHFAGGVAAGELGGVVFRGDNRSADKLACYGDRLAPLSAEKPLRASGRVCLRRGVSDSTVLLGFYHSQDSLAVSEDQSSGFPVNFLGLAIEGPSREGFLLYPVYRFGKAAQGYAQGEDRPHILPDGQPLDWEITYVPPGATRPGRIKLVATGRTVTIDLAAGDRNVQARFDRFGLVTTWIDGNSQRVYFDDLSYTTRQD